jgi:RNA polymerase sigma factor (sigma-70 family)
MYDFIKDIRDDSILSEFYEEIKVVFEKKSYKTLDPDETKECFHQWLLNKFGIVSQFETAGSSSTIFEKIKDEILKFDSKEKFLAYLRKSMETYISTYSKRERKGKSSYEEEHLDDTDQGNAAQHIEKHDIFIECVPGKNKFYREKVDEKAAQAYDSFDGQKRIPSCQDQRFHDLAMQIFQSLDLEKKLLLSLYIVEDISLEEISTILGIPRSTVHYRLKIIYSEFKDLVTKKYSLPEERNDVIRELAVILERWYGKNLQKWTLRE